MQLGIIGLPQSGKTTIFNALTRGDQPITMNGGRFEIHTAVVQVCDTRVERLSELFRPQKTTFARVTFADIAGLERIEAAVADTSDLERIVAAAVGIVAAAVGIARGDRR